MFKNLARSMIVTALMFGAATLSVVAVPNALLSETRTKFNLDEAVPKSFGDWSVDASVVPLPPSPDQQSVLNQIYDQILSRTYINGKGERIMLSITYGSRQNQQMRAHRQEVCYSAQGFRISELQRTNFPLADGPVSGTRMVATQGSRVEPVTYWFTMGDHVVLSYLDREAIQFKYAMTGYIPDGYLVRISSLSAKPEQAFKRHLSFADSLFKNIDAGLKRRLVGSV